MAEPEPAPCLDLWREVDLDELHWQFALTRMSEVIQPPFTNPPNQVRLTLNAVEEKVKETETADNITLLAHSCWFANEIPRAEELYKKALEMNAQNPLVNRFYGLFLLWKQKWDAAADRLRVAIASEPGNLEARAALAEALFMKGKKKKPEIKEMEENYTTVEAGDTNAMSNETLVRIAVYKQHLKEWRAAVFFFEIAMTRSAVKSFYVLSRYGDFCRAVGRINDAEQFLNGALELRPDSVWARVRLAHVRYLRGDVDGALREYQILIHFVKTEETIGMYADLLRIKGDATSARDMYEKIAERAPTFLWVLSRLWWMNLSLGKPNDGDYIETIGNIQSEQSRFLPNWYKNDLTIIQAVYEATSDIADDLAHGTWAAGGYDQSAELQYSFACTVLKGPDEFWGKAQKALNKALDIDPSHYKSLLKLAEVHTNEGPLQDQGAVSGELERATEILSRVFEPQERHRQAKQRLIDLMKRAGVDSSPGEGLY